jgi:hypothetical protein
MAQIEDLWIYALGYSYSILGCLSIVRAIVDKMWIGIGWSGDVIFDENRPHTWHVRILGTLEAILYTSSWLAGKAEFIGVWIALKVAGNWNRWTVERHVFSIFLIGNAFVILFSVCGASLIKWINNNEWPIALIVGSGLIVFGLFIFVLANKYCKKSIKPKS